MFYIFIYIERERVYNPFRLPTGDLFDTLRCKPTGPTGDATVKGFSDLYTVHPAAGPIPATGKPVDDSLGLLYLDLGLL